MDNFGSVATTVYIVKRVNLKSTYLQPRTVLSHWICGSRRSFIPPHMVIGDSIAVDCTKMLNVSGQGVISTLEGPYTQALLL